MKATYTTARRIASAMAILDSRNIRYWLEDEGQYEWDEVRYLYQRAVKPVSGKSLEWMLSHGGREWLSAQGFEPYYLDKPRFNPTAKYVVFVEDTGYYVFHRWEHYKEFESKY